MNILDRLLKPKFTTQEHNQQYLDGFATTYPLEGQPDYPVHDSPHYRYGLRIGRKTTKKYGPAGVPYEPYEIEEEEE